MITSSNADFDENGFAALVRDMERAYLLLSELGVEAGDSNVSTTLRFDGGGQFPASQYWVGPSEGPYNTLTVNNTVIGGDTTRGLAGADGVNGQNGTNGVGGFTPDQISGDGAFINVDNSVFTVSPGDNIFLTDAIGNRINPGQEAGIGVGTKLKVTAVTPAPYVLPNPLNYVWINSPVTRTVGFGSGQDIATNPATYTGGIWSKKVYGNHSLTTSMSRVATGGIYGTILRTQGTICATGNATYDNGMLTGLRYLNGISSTTQITSSTLGSWSSTVNANFTINPYGVSGESIPDATSDLTGQSFWSAGGSYYLGIYRLSNSAGYNAESVFGISPYSSSTSSNTYYMCALDRNAISNNSYLTFNMPNLFYASVQRVSGTRSGTLHIFPNSMASDGKIQMTGYSIDLVDATGNIKINGTQVLAQQQATVTAPSGGATIDSQARTAINAIIARLQSHGLIA